MPLRPGDISSRTKPFELKSYEPTPQKSTPQIKVVLHREPVISVQNAWRIYNAALSVSILATYVFSENKLSYNYLVDASLYGLQSCVSKNSPEWARTTLNFLNRCRIAQICIEQCLGTSVGSTSAKILNVLHSGININMLEE